MRRTLHSRTRNGTPARVRFGVPNAFAPCSQLVLLLRCSARGLVAGPGGSCELPLGRRLHVSSKAASAKFRSCPVHYFLTLARSVSTVFVASKAASARRIPAMRILLCAIRIQAFLAIPTIEIAVQEGSSCSSGATVRHALDSTAGISNSPPDTPGDHADCAVSAITATRCAQKRHVADAMSLPDRIFDVGPVQK